NIDISGGSVSYADGLVNTTKLMSRGRIYDIGSADPNLRYEAVLGVRDELHPKWGLTEVGGNSAFAKGIYRVGFTEGAAGGVLNIETPTLYGFDLLDLDAQIQQGQRQRLENVVAGASRVAIDVAVSNDASLIQNVTMQQLAVSDSLSVDGVLPAVNGGRPLLNLSTDALNRSGLGEFKLDTDGHVHIAPTANLQLGSAAKL